MADQSRWGSSLVRKAPGYGAGGALPQDPFMPSITWGMNPQQANPNLPGGGGNGGGPSGGPGWGNGGPMDPLDPFWTPYPPGYDPADPWPGGGGTPGGQGMPGTPKPPPPKPGAQGVGVGGLAWTPPGWLPPMPTPPTGPGPQAYDAGSRFRRMGGGQWTNIDDSPLFGRTNAPKAANPQTDPFAP